MTGLRLKLSQSPNDVLGDRSQTKITFLLGVEAHSAESAVVLTLLNLRKCFLR